MSRYKGTLSKITLKYTLLQAAMKRHNLMLRTLMKSMITFFDCTPIGYIYMCVCIYCESKLYFLNIYIYIYE